MKHIATYALLLLLCTLTTKGFSQGQGTAKPKLFANSPDKFDCQDADLTTAFAATQGQNVNLNFSNNFIFSGTVISNVVKYNNNLQTVLIRSTTLDNTLLSISRRVDADRSTSYIGRIINQKYFDGYELQKDASGKYQFSKIETDRVIQPCSQH
jgi:hypothetical protein